jgi:hypothetical protein
MRLAGSRCRRLAGARRLYGSGNVNFPKLTTGFSSRIANVQESFFYPVGVAGTPSAHALHTVAPRVASATLRAHTLAQRCHLGSGAGGAISSALRRRWTEL